MDRLHHHDLTIRNCRAGAQGPPLNNENAANARKLKVLTGFGGPERSRVCRRLGTCAGVSAVSDRPRRSAGPPGWSWPEYRARVARDHQVLVGRDHSDRAGAFVGTDDRVVARVPLGIEADAEMLRGRNTPPSAPARHARPGAAGRGRVRSPFPASGSIGMGPSILERLSRPRVRGARPSGVVWRRTRHPCRALGKMSLGLLGSERRERPLDRLGSPPVAPGDAVDRHDHQVVRDLGEEVRREVPRRNTLVPRTRADDAAKLLGVRASPSLKEREQAARVEDHDE